MSFYIWPKNETRRLRLSVSFGESKPSLVKNELAGTTRNRR